jgi:M3 family oligoendopeptidase
MTPPKLSEMPYARPDLAALRAATEAQRKAWAVAGSAEAQMQVLKAWDRDRIALDTARSLAGLRYQCDTRSASTKAEREFFDEVAPQLDEMRLDFLRDAVKSPHRPELQRMIGSHAFAIWEQELTAYDPVIAEDRREESRLCRRFTELMADMRVEHDGKRVTMPQAGAWFGDPDRGVRLRIQQARFAAMEEKREELDSIYDDLVRVRDAMGRKMGRDGYVPLAYTLRGRDYTPAQVASFRKQVEEVLVPLASRIRSRHAAALGVSDYAFHDTFVAGDLRGVPKPKGDAAWMCDRAGEMFARLGPDFAGLWSVLRDGELLDLEAREAKAGGGFCTDLQAHGVPFVFANFNGTADDVDVFTHECGHAYQSWRSMALQPLSDYFGPTNDAAEIHSMSLEMLCHPMAELFFEEDASRYRQKHLEAALLFIPYGTAIDEFQHEVYLQPSLTPAQRAEVWRHLERKYLPERKYPGMPFAESGRAWQLQRHVYLSPFYYIDYCLAQTCALQFWQRSRADRDAAMEAYRRICELGGSRPFSGIVASAGLTSPFAPGCLQGLAGDLEGVLAG